MSTSIDGLVAGPRGHAGALPEPVELTRWKLERIRRAGTHIMGRVTYEETAAHWHAWGKLRLAGSSILTPGG
jgi:hypothetical protein